MVSTLWTTLYSLRRTKFWFSCLLPSLSTGPRERVHAERCVGFITPSYPDLFGPLTVSLTHYFLPLCACCHRYAGDDVEVGAGSSSRPDTFWKRKWISELDALLLREVKLQNTHEQRHGKKGNVSENMAFNLNYSARLSWITDRKHLQGRVQHLLEERLANQRATARATGIEEENGALEVLLDDFIEEADAFKSTEV
jgi:hypothetical protein